MVDFLGSLLGKLLPTLLSVGKNIVAPLTVGAAMSATDAAIQKKVAGGKLFTDSVVDKLSSELSDTNLTKSHDTYKLCISSNELTEIIKIMKALEESGVLVDGTSKMFVEDHIDGQKGGFLGALLGTLGASLLGNLLSGKGVIRAGEGVIRAGQYGTGGDKKKN